MKLLRTHVGEAHVLYGGDTNNNVGMHWPVFAVTGPLLWNACFTRHQWTGQLAEPRAAGVRTAPGR